MFLHSDGFLSRGWTGACFSWFGITPSESDAFVMSVMTDASERMLSLMCLDGIGSMWHVLDGLVIFNSISNVTIGVRNRRVSRSGVWHWLLAPSNLVRISAILSLKYAENVLAHSLSES